MGAEIVQFDWLEYTVFGCLLFLSVLIGVYFGFIRGGQDTAAGYLLGGKNMNVLPVAVSLICTHISGVTLLGIPTEIYTYGTQYLVGAATSFGSLGLLFAYVIIPVFYKLQIVSLYEYLEMRFNDTVRKVVSFIYTLYLLVYLPVVIYGPGLALNQVSGISVFGITSILSMICIFYTTAGGLRAVVWADTLQGGMMIISSVILAYVGTANVGGWSGVIDAARKGERLEFFNFDPDPRRRSTFWTTGIGVPLIVMTTSLVNPSYMQRFLALPTMKKAQWSSLILSIGCYFFLFTSIYMGMVLHAQYIGCDPLLSGRISKADQIYPFFVAESTRDLRGLSGIFIAGVAAAALSTMSTGINTVAGTLYYDFIEGWCGKTSEKRTSIILKTLAAMFGILCWLLVLVVERLTTIVEIVNSVVGTATGVITGVILLGMFLPQTNSKGAAAGVICSMCFMVWILVGSKAAYQAGEIVYERKPVSISECTFNVTNNRTLPEPSFGKAFPLYEISIFYYCALGVIACMTVGITVSFLTGPNRADQVNRELLSTLIYKYLPTYSAVSTKEVELNKISEDEPLNIPH